MKHTTLAALLGLTSLTATAPAALFIDFDNDGLAPLGGQEAGGPRTQSGFQSYRAGNEVSGTFSSQSFSATFGGAATTVSILPTWNTTDIRVQQMINRGAGNDANWNNSNSQINLVTDWLGTDTRTGGGGNGDYNGVTGTPTHLMLSLGGLGAGTYSMTSLHHDTENMNTFFDIAVSINGGTTYSSVVTNARMTASTGTGTPAVTPTTGPDVFALSSTQTYGFTANGVDDVVIRYTPRSNSDALNGGGVHQTFFAINGFTLIPEPSTPLLGLVSLGFLTLRRRR